MIIQEQLEKLLYSVERLKEDIDKNKRAAVGHCDFIRDRTTSILYLLLAEIEEENNNGK